MVYLRNVTTITLDSSACNGCARCVDVCARAVLHMADGRAQIVNRDACIECGACQRNCASGALSVQSGVGCAAAMIQAATRPSRKGKPPQCGCSGSACCG
jgi:NAD-dependent dihydropyrimidine dehydrogenase PreA subunit